MTRSTLKTKGHSIIKSKMIYPDFNLMDYDVSLRVNLSFYNLEVSNPVKKAEALAYWKSLGKDIKNISKLSDSLFSTCGAVAHMTHSRDIDLEEKHLHYLDNKYNELKLIKVEEDDSTKPQISKEDKDEISTTLHIEEFEHGLDLILKGQKFDAKSYLIRHEVKPAITKNIANWFKKYLKEIKEIKNDEQLQESYSFLTKPELSKLRNDLDNMINSCEVATAIIKASRKPREKKIKAPSEVVKKVKYLKEFLNLKSLSPEKIINSNEVWLFNSKVRRLFKYSSLQGMTFSVKGTTLTNVDVEKSGGKTLRKPSEQLKDIESFTSRPMNKLYNDVRAIASKATGRINEDTIILKCF